MTSAVAAGPVGEVWPAGMAGRAGPAGLDGLVDAGGSDEAGLVDVAGVVVFVVGGWMARWTDVEGSMDWLTAEKVDLILKLVGGLVTLVGGFVCLRLLPALADYRAAVRPLHAAEMVTMACKKAASTAQQMLAAKKDPDAAMEQAIRVALDFLEPNAAAVAALYTRGEVVDAVKTYVNKKVPGMSA